VRRILLTMDLAAAVLGGSAAAQDAAEPPQPETLAQKARKLYVNACSAMRTRQWGQARGLFERYLKLYGTHEYAPVGYLNLAWCHEGMKDAAAREKALDEVCKRFPGSPAWETAFVARLAAARQADDHDGYLKLLDDMTRTGLVPLRVYGDLGWEFGRYRSANYSVYRANSGYDVEPMGPGGVYRAPGWVAGIAEMADTPERARKALRALGRNFSTFARELPGDWQYVRVALMRAAEQADQAQAAYDQYVKDWGDDPRAIQLFVTEIEHLVRAKQYDKADAAFQAVLEKFPGAGGLAEPLRGYLYTARRERRQESFSRLAPHYLKHYTASVYWHTFSSYWQSLAVGQTDKKDAGAAALLKRFDEVYPEHTPGQRRGKALAKMRLLMTLDRVAEAADAAKPLITQEMWSGYSFNTIASQAASHKPFAALVEAARKKWRIPVPNPTSEAFGMLNKLRLRLRDDQVRHAEEIGEEMFAKHRDDASTIEAVKALADYYFAKVLPQPRDKWMTRMIQAYPFHPQTEAVLANRIRADQAAKQYKKLAESLDTMLERFAGAFSAEHYRLRISCYSAAQDADGAQVFARKFYGQAARAGHIYAIDEIAARQLAGKTDDYKARGDCWMEWARAVPGTRAEVHCLIEARLAYYRIPWGRGGSSGPLWDQALPVSRAMAKTTADPEVTWVARFDEVNLLADKGDAEAALAAMDGALKGTRRIRGLSYRVDFTSLGEALGRAKLTDKGAALARRLKGVCFTGRDRRAIDLMLGRMYDVAEDPKAADHYLQAVKAHPFPARWNHHFVAALRCLSRARAAARYRTEVEAHLRRIGRVQELVPGLMASAGAHYLGNRDPQALTMQRRLTSRYPASDARDTLDAAVQRARERARPR